MSARALGFVAAAAGASLVASAGLALVGCRGLLGISDGVELSDAGPDGDDGGELGDADDAPGGGPPVGTVEIFVSALDARVGNASVAFDATQGAPCVVATSGSCRVVCRTTTVHASAGTVRFTGGSPSVSFTATPNADGSYSQPLLAFSGDFPFSGGGGSATISATGATVPAFSQPLSYPALFVLQQPFVPDGGSGELTVPRTSDLTFTWSRGTADGVVRVDGGSADLALACSFPALGGAGTIASSLLGRMPAGTPLTVLAMSKTVTQAGSSPVTTYLGGQMLTPSKNAAVSFTLE